MKCFFQLHTPAPPMKTYDTDEANMTVGDTHIKVITFILIFLN